MGFFDFFKGSSKKNVSQEKVRKPIGEGHEEEF